MTNAEKYLKDGIDREELLDEFQHYLAVNGKKLSQFSTRAALDFFLCENIKPTLTEDERVILKNIDKKYKYISKSKEDTELFLRKEADDTCSYIFRGYNHLFQFIKERRRI